jgi:hypothetical protein
MRAFRCGTVQLAKFWSWKSDAPLSLIAISGCHHLASKIEALLMKEHLK